jgi:hypothetical protein
MSRTPALPQLPHLLESHRLVPEGSALRLADDEAAPIESPVHALQRQLVRLQAGADESDSPRRKAPGWVRVGMPLTLSIGLWLEIIQIIGALWR